MTPLFSKIGYVLILMMMIAFPVNLNAQELSTESRKAIKYFEEGERNFNLQYYNDAKADLLKAIDADVKFLEAYMLLADVYRFLDDNQEALKTYTRLIDLDSGKYPEAYFFSGVLYFEELDYSIAIKRFQKYLKNADSTSARFSDAKFYKACAEFARNAVKNPVPFSPVNVGTDINTANDEYINAVKSDGQTLFFTGRQNLQRGVPGGDDFYYSMRKSDSSVWEASQKLGPPINTSGDEGALTISPDGQYFLFAGCQWADAYGSCDIYVAKLSGNQVGQPINLGSVINSGSWESQPSLSSDGRTLYFASSRGGGSGKSDIWKSYLQDDGRWSAPQNLGGTVNTSGSEMAPFIHPDGQSLYFSSDRHVGMGGIDLFVSRLDTSGNWTKPLNLGYPVNTPGNEINVVVNVAGNKAYISSDKLEGEGGFDIFEFEMHDEIRPVPSTFMKGVVVDAVSQKPLEAYFSLRDLDSKKEIVRSFSDKNNGAFLVCIPANRSYALNVSKESYLFYSENFSFQEIKTDIEPYLINIDLQPIRVGEIMVLRNVFYESGEFLLKEESMVELENLIEFLNYNPKVHVEISGHTDNIGSEAHNMELSSQRAKAVYDHLIGNGISVDRLTYRGCGFTKPQSDNESDLGRSKNRRTEVSITEITD